MITKNQFEVLVTLDQEKDSPVTQRRLGELLELSVGTVNKTLAELEELGLIDNKYAVSEEGYAALEPYRVKKAVILAAGFGSRLVPVTLNTPKPLVRVKGKRIIDGLLDALLAVGIDDITLVRGYLKEEFDVLLNKYPMIKFIDNDIYNEANNISSAVLVRDKIANAYVAESDLLVYNPKIIRKYEYETNYLSKKVDVTDDWCFKTKSGYITEVLIGGRDVHQMYGISYWSKEDADKFEKHSLEVFESPGGKEKFWDEVALTNFKKDYKIAIRPCQEGDIIEIDTFNELKQIDETYNV